MHYFSRISLFFILILTPFLDAKPPPLTSYDTRVKIQEILKLHASYQELTPEIIQRALSNYIDELDPSKTYFFEKEISSWIQPPNRLLNRVLKEYKKENFSVFEEIHQIMLGAIERREKLENSLDLENLPKGVKASEFQDLDWAKSEKELLERIERIRALQLQTAEKFDLSTQEGAKEQFLQRLEQRRVKREREIQGENPIEAKQIVYTYFLKAISSALDSQTYYFTPTEAQSFMRQMQQKLTGIGAQLKDTFNGLTIMRLLEGGPAIKGNRIKTGDRIIAVDNQSIIGMDIVDAVEMIRGKEGTPVLLTIIRESGEENNKEEEKLDIELVRGEIALTENRYESSCEPFGNGVIAHLKLFTFYNDKKNSSAKDLEKLLNDYKKQHKVQGVILDLRGNAGGLLDEAVDVAGLFIKKGVVVSIKDNSGQVRHKRNFNHRPTWDGPLFVLTDKGSASASEIVAQTLQEYGRALVIGDHTTFGKGTFQEFTLASTKMNKVNPKGEYKVTCGRYYTVSGKSPQLNGVKADIAIPGIFSYIDLGEEHSKYPLSSDEIEPAYNDMLEDISPRQRAQIISEYQENAQSIEKRYNPYIEQLRSNSKQRLDKNQNYQNFLKEIEKEDYSSPTVEFFGQSDLQAEETLNIMKDLILLEKMSS